MSKPTLKRCKKCGGKAKCLPLRQNWVAFCDSTMCEIGPLKPTEAEAIAAWNEEKA